MPTPRFFCIALFALPFFCCTNPSQPEKAGSENGLFTGSATASFEILKKDSMAGVTYKAVDVRYQVEFIAPKGDGEASNYLAKYTTTTNSCTGCEGQERSMAVEISALDQPEQTIYSIRHDCDEIILDLDYYKTIKHGCCGAEDELALYDYNNKPIIQGDGKIVLGSIPNSGIKLWAGYKSNFQDTTFQGTIYISYNSAELYEIKITSAPLSSDHCNPYSPDISIVSASPKDEKIDGRHEYDLWSLDGLTDKSKIDGLTLKFNFECDEGFKPAPIEIPLIGGKPFGKAEKKQTVAFEMIRK